MSERRLLHVLGVSHVMVTLAAAHRLDIAAAALVALLHDMSKDLAPDEIAADLDRLGQAIPDEDHDHPRVWHGLHAAAWARERWGLDGELFEAVALHTTADAGVGPLTCALYIADVCEPGRHNPHAAEILEGARADLEEGFRQALAHKLRHVAHKRGTLHPRSLRAMTHWLSPEQRRLLEVEMSVLSQHSETIGGPH